MRCRSEARAHPGSRARLALLATLVPVAAAGCDLLTDPFSTNDFSGDPFPVPVALQSGAVLLHAREQVGYLPALIDVLAPFSIYDPGPSPAAQVNQRSLLLLSGPEEAPIARARVSGPIVDLHPCSNTDPNYRCEVGRDGALQSVHYTIGADLLAGDALRLDLSQQQLFLFPDIPGADSDRSDACDAVFSQPFRGGGTLLIGGTELPYVGRRIAISACAAPRFANPPLLPNENPDAALLVAGPRFGLPPRERGVDLLLVASTSVGVTLLAESAYDRYALAEGLPRAATLPRTGGATLQSGRIACRPAKLSSLALVGKASARGACGDVYAHRYLTYDVVRSKCQPAERNCPCDNLPCGAPAVVELPTSVDVLLISDAEPLLLGLRTELRPDEAEVDGVIGTELLARMSFDIDYPNNRVLARCAGPADGTTCLTRPEYPNPDRLDRVVRCLANQVPSTIAR
jgi:hypothetical protein